MVRKKREKKRLGTPSAALTDGFGTRQGNYERETSISRSTLYDEYKRSTTSFTEGLALIFPSLGTKILDPIVAADALADAENCLSTILRTLRSPI
jgi:hypothetical protein